MTCRKEKWSVLDYRTSLTRDITLGVALCNKDPNPPGGALLVFRVRRIRRDGKLPEPRPVSLALNLAHPHRAHHGLITDFNILIDAQIVHPNRIRWCAPPCDPTRT